MSNRTGGSFSTLLLSLPLAAVAFMAVFGVPQFIPMVASGGDEELDHRSSRRGDRGRNLENLFDEFTNEPEADAPAFSGNDRNASSADSPWWEREHPQNTSSDTRPAYASVGQNGPQDRTSDLGRTLQSGDPATPEQFPVSRTVWANENQDLQVTLGSPQGQVQTAMTTDLLDWQSASRRLAEIGVSKYHLERGHREGTFLFVCLFTSAGNPNQVNRFEAEANDPLHAVNDVLKQIDQWLKQQYAARTSSPSRGARL